MTRASPDMHHCFTTPGICADMTVLERQTSCLKRNLDQLPHHYLRNYSAYCFPASIQAAQIDNSLTSGGEKELSEVNPEMGLENGWSGLGKFEIPTVGSGSGLELNPSISRTSNSPTVVIEVKKPNSPVGRESFKKRKTNSKIVNEEDSEEKRIKVCAEEGDLKVTDQIQTKNNSTASTAIRETSADTSKENSKASEVQKPDYIHVRARRGQATDSHSLAERARREKIGERMKYLQDLVPGCNKITGKAGMLDEIINYVQSLERQVEFLSMKLAAVNPGLDFNPILDEICPKEAQRTCASKFPPLSVQSELDSPVYLHFDQSLQMGSFCGQEMSSDGLRRTISAPVSVPENFLVPTCFPVSSSTPFLPSSAYTQNFLANQTLSLLQIQPSSAWDVYFQSLYNVGFDQERTEAFPSQPYTGR